jgi:hypothetical protein
MLAIRDLTSASSDSSVYTTCKPALELGESLSVSSDSGTIKDVAHHSWYLHVGPLVVTIVVSLSSPGYRVLKLFPNLQLGVRHQSSLRVGCYSRTSNLSMDDMGTRRSALALTSPV